MSLNRILAIVLRQFYLVRGSVSRLLPMFMWVLIDMVLWGFITRYLNRFTQSGFDFVPALLGAVLLWDFLTRVMHGLTMAFFEDVWSRNFLNIFASPMTIAEYLSGLVLSSICTSSIALVVMVLVATLGFGLSFFVYGATLAAFFLVLFLCGIALGIVGTSIVLRLGPAAEWFIWPVPAMLSPFVGVFYPLSTLPVWMRAISYALPPSYVFENMRAIVAGRHPSLPALAMSAVLAAGYILLACWYFSRTYRYAVRVGLIPRYSAETVS
jgi:ABC-2 type transport system permease protein